MQGVWRPVSSSRKSVAAQDVGDATEAIVNGKGSPHKQVRRVPTLLGHDDGKRSAAHLLVTPAAVPQRQMLERAVYRVVDSRRRQPTWILLRPSKPSLSFDRSMCSYLAGDSLQCSHASVQ